MEYGYLFNNLELALSKHLCNSVIAAGIPDQFRAILSSPYSDQRLFCNKNYIPAYDQTTMLRKLMIKSKIDEAIKNGTRQMVFLGGGYDIRAFMTAKMHNVRVYELDRGPTRAKKIAAILSIPENLGFGEMTRVTYSDGTVAINDKLFFIECDFIKDNLAKKLAIHGYDKDQKTLVIAEGLTAYLNVDDNKKLLSTLNSIMKESDELLIGYIDKGEKSAELMKTLKDANEEHKLALEPEGIVSFSSESGFAITHQFFPTQLLAKIGDQMDAEVYKTNRKLVKEYYLLMQVGKGHYQHFHEVPAYEFAIPGEGNLLKSTTMAK